MRPLRERDESGWRIPTPGTKSRRIYELARDGNSIGDIAHWVESSSETVRQLLFRIRRPDHYNATQRQNRKMRRQT